jgi:hypothetical protein
MPSRSSSWPPYHPRHHSQQEAAHAIHRAFRLIPAADHLPASRTRPQPRCRRAGSPTAARRPRRCPRNPRPVPPGPHHDTHELPHRGRAQGPFHPGTLTTRANIANWTGHSGDPAEALRLTRGLLPDREAVLGPATPTLITRHNIAHWTSQSGDPASALRLYQELLPDLDAVLGPSHPIPLRCGAAISELGRDVPGDPLGP